MAVESVSVLYKADISKNKYIKSIPCTVSTKTKYDTLIPVMAIVNSVSSFSRFSFRILFRDNDLLNDTMEACAVQKPQWLHVPLLKYLAIMQVAQISISVFIPCDYYLRYYLR
jgi:hypothetical protein